MLLLLWCDIDSFSAMDEILILVFRIYTNISNIISISIVAIAVLVLKADVVLLQLLLQLLLVFWLLVMPVCQCCCY